MNEEFMRRMSNRLYAEKTEDESNNTFAMDMSELSKELGSEYEDYESVGTTEFEGEVYSDDEEGPEQKESSKISAEKKQPQTQAEKTGKPRPPARTVDESMSVKKTEAVVKKLMKETSDERKESLGVAKASPTKPKTTGSNTSQGSSGRGTKPRKKGTKKEAAAAATGTGGKVVMKRRKSRDGQKKVEKKATFDTLKDDRSESGRRKQGSGFGTGFAKSRFTRRRGNKKKKDPKAVAEQVERIYNENEDDEFEYRNPEVKDTEEIETANYHEMLNYGLKSPVLEATGGVKAVIQKQKEIELPEAQEDSDLESQSASESESKS